MTKTTEILIAVLALSILFSFIKAQEAEKQRALADRLAIEAFAQTELAERMALEADQQRTIAEEVQAKLAECSSAK